MTVKFKDPETGEVIPIYVALSRYCDTKWMELHPHEVARLMGYEVVEDETPIIEEAIDKYLEIKQEEANMEKPRIAQVLGVEVEEKFTIGENQYFIDKNGDMWCVTKNGEKLRCGTAICSAINHPDRIIRKPRFTEQEVEDAKYIRRILKVDSVRRNIYGNGLIAMKSDNTVSVVINFEMFPSIHSGELYTLDEIIGGAE